MDLRIEPSKRCFLYWYDAVDVPLYASICTSSLKVVGGFEELILCTNALHPSDLKKLRQHFPDVTEIVLPSAILLPEMFETYKSLVGKYEAVNKADFYRICALYLYGGFYCDTDIFAIQPFQTLPLTESYISAEDTENLNNGLLFSTKGFSVFEYMIEHFMERWIPNSFNSVGPPWFTEFKDEFNVVWDVNRHNSIHWTNCSKIIASASIDVEELIKQGVYSIHLWGTSLRRLGIEINSTFIKQRPDSMFSSLVKFLAEKGSLICQNLV